MRRIVKTSFVIIIFLLALCSCKTKKKEVKSINKKEPVAIQYNYNNIQTDSYKDDFKGDLINTLPVREGDTVLFRQWGDEDYIPNKIYLTEENIKYKIEDTKYIKYYKTGDTKFSLFGFSIENSITKESFKFYMYSNHGVIKNPYHHNKMSGYAGLDKVSKNKGAFDIFYLRNEGGDFIYFEIKNGEIQITQLKRMDRSDYDSDWYQLDTLISINKSNNLIDIKALKNVLLRDENIRKYKP